jgi:hypothetical protein
MWSRTVTAVLALTVVGTEAWAQGGNHRLGFVGGVSIATLAGAGANQIPGKESRIGFMAGGYVEIGVHRNFAVSPEVYYIMKGVKSTDGDEEVTGKVDFLEVPVLFKVVFPNESGARLRPHLYAGPALGIQVSCKTENSVKIDCDSPTSDVRVKDIDLGIVFGGGIDIGSFFVGARYDLGLTNLNDDPDATDADEFKTRAFAVVVGASIPVGMGRQ